MRDAGQAADAVEVALDARQRVACERRAVYGHGVGGQVACGLPGHGGGGVGLLHSHADRAGEGQVDGGIGDAPVLDEGDVAAGAYGDLLHGAAALQLSFRHVLEAADQVVEKLVVGVELDGDAIRGWGDDGAPTDALEELALFGHTAA